MRLLMIPQILLGISAYYSSALNVHHRYIIPQIAPFFYNIGRMLGAFFLIPTMGVEGLVWGTILGSVLHLVIQIPIARKLGIVHKPFIRTDGKYFKASMKVGIPRLIGLGGEQVAIGVNRFIAARFIQGSVTAYNFAVQLVSIPISLFGITFSNASFPTLAETYQQGKKKEFACLFTDLLNQILFLAVPVTVTIIILRMSLVRLLYGIFGGEFTWEDTSLTAWVVMFFAMGISFESLRTLIYRVFYAAGDTIRPLVGVIFNVIFGIITSIIFTNYFSNFGVLDFRELTWNPFFFFSSATGRAAVGGLALSSSLTELLEFILLMFLLNKYVTKINWKDFFVKLWKKILAGLIMATIMFPIFKLWGDSLHQTRTIPLMFLVSITTIVGMLSYIVASYFLRIKEFKLFTTLLRKISPKKLKLVITQMDNQVEMAS